MRNKLSQVKDASDFARRLRDQHFRAKISNIQQLTSLGFDEEAVKELKNIQQMKSLTVKQSVLVADCLYKLGKYNECLTILGPLEDNVNHMLQSDLSDKLALLNLLGMVYRSLEKDDQAVKMWKRCLEINSRYTIALNNLGNHFMKTRSFAEAAKCYWRSKKCNQQFTRFSKTQQPSCCLFQFGILLHEGRADQ